MEILIPIGVLVLAFCLALLYLREAYATKKIKVGKLLFVGTILLAYVLILLVFYKTIEKDTKLSEIFEYIYVGTYFILGLAFVFTTNNETTKKFIYDEYLKCIEDEKIFIYLDRNDRIKGISAQFASAFEADKDDLIGKKFFDVFNKMFNIESINNEQFHNDDLRKMFKGFRNVTEPVKIKRDITVRDVLGDVYTLKLTDCAILVNGKYKAHCLIGDAQAANDSAETTELKKEESNKAQFDELRLKFTAHLQLTEESMFFFNLAQSYIWSNDTMVKELQLTSNTITRDEYLSRIHKDDIEQYARVLNSLTPHNPTYDMSYRFRMGNTFVYVRDHGKRLYENGGNEIMGYTKIIPSSHYERSNISELDNVKALEDLVNDMNNLWQSGRPFQLVSFRIDNIPQINAQYGRSFGNMVMAEYLKAIWRNFVEEQRIYRTSGLEFMFIITNLQGMEKLRNVLLSNKLLTPTMRYGSTTLKANVYMGIQGSHEAATPEALFRGTDKCLRQAMKEDCKENYVYYKDLRG